MAKKKQKSSQRQITLPAEQITIAVVQSAIEQENSQKSLDLAKIYIKTHPGLEGETLLARAYELRIRKLHQSGLVQDAQKLIEIAKEKCPHSIDLFIEVQKETFHFPLTREEVFTIAPIVNSSFASAEKKEHFLHILKIGLHNPGYILECPALLDDSFLKREALIIQEAFEAVVNSLPETARIEKINKLSSISRHSPLSNWCLFIRALGAYHQNEDSRALDLLNHMPEISALSPAKTILTAKINKNNKPDGLSSHSTRALWKVLTPESPVSDWRDILQAIDSEQRRTLRNKVESFFHSNWISSPFMAREFSRSIVNHMIHADFFDGDTIDFLIDNLGRYYKEKSYAYIQLAIFNAMGPMCSPFNMEQVLHLDRDRKISLTAKEKAMILAMAGKFSASQSEDDCDFGILSIFSSKSATDYTKAVEYYTKACNLHPLSDYFLPLVLILEKAEKSTTEIEELLQNWKDSNPQDCAPLIHLFERAEKRDALQKAIKFLEQAEKIDPLNPKVRSARERLVWRLIKKHLEQKRFPQIEQDLKQIDITNLPPVKKAIFNSVVRFLAIIENRADPGPGDFHPVFSTLIMYHLCYSTDSPFKQLYDAVPLEDLDTMGKLEIYLNLRDALLSIGDIPNFPMAWFQKFPGWIMQAEPISEELLIRISQTILKMDSLIL